MAQLARQYSIMEVRKLLEACEGRGPGVGGHAIAEHGEARVDVTDRGKANDSAFQREIRIFGKRLTTPGATNNEPSKPVPPMDQAMVVAFALNSMKGQQKLSELERKADGSGTAIVTEMQAIFSILPELRIGHGRVASTGTLPKIKVEIFKIAGGLHIHTAYAMA
jgi:hypothetical protein